MARDTLAELAPFVAGMPVDQVAMRARRAQMAQGSTQPVGLAQLAGLGVKTTQKAISGPNRPSAKQSKTPSLAELLYANATKFDLKAPIVGSIQPTDQDRGWFSIRDLPLEAQRVLVAAGEREGKGVAGFSADRIVDPAQRNLLIDWIVAGEQERAARADQAAQNDPKFREQLAAAQAAMTEE